MILSFDVGSVFGTWSTSLMNLLVFRINLIEIID